MCGIAGIITPNAERHGDTLQRMTDALAHRGPDGEGFHFFENCALGHRRLAVVDIESGAQPILSPLGRTGVILNGEIYDYKDIRAGLSYPFQTQSDTEVLLALYERHGRDMLSYVPGMFAFALWDEAEQTLFCARDRFGEKPLYYTWGANGEFLFASEIKALLASGLVRGILNRDSLSHYLQRLCVPAHESIYANIHTLPPAHCLTLKQGKVAVRRYWDLPHPVAVPSFDEAVERFQALFARAVARQMIADVEVAAFLSGGLDSSSVVAEAVRRGGRLRTISFGFESALDERPYAEAVAAMYGTTHLALGEEHLDLPALTRQMAVIYDEPFADSSNIPTHLICRQASTHVKAVLTGDGGDELLGGYGWYQPLIENAPQPACAHKRAEKNLLRRLRRFFFRPAAHAPALSIAETHRRQTRLFADEELLAIGLPLANDASLPTLYGGVDDAFRMDIAAYMPQDILVKTDRAAMASGLELRAPFLDVDLAGYLISLPAAFKMAGGQSKLLLRKAYAEQWPETLRNRTKQGFGAPVDVWLQRPEMKELCADVFSPGKRIYSLLPGEFVQAQTIRGDYRTWVLLTLALWLEEYGHALEC